MTSGIEAAFIAFLPSDPELRTSQAGQPFLTFSAGVGEGDAVQWIRTVAFGERAVELSRVLAKGSKVYVEGRLTMQEWSGRNGEQRHGLNVAAWRVEPLRQIGRNRPRKDKAREAAPTTADDGTPFNDALPDWRGG